MRQNGIGSIAGYSELNKVRCKLLRIYPVLCHLSQVFHAFCGLLLHPSALQLPYRKVTLFRTEAGGHRLFATATTYSD